MSTDVPEPTPWDPEREETETEARPDRGDRRWWIVGTVAVAVGVALTIWFGLSSSQGAVKSTDIGFERPGEREIVMIFDVTRPSGTTLSCTITALDGEYGRVGTKEQEIPASEEATTRVRAKVRTTTTAVTATVQDCTPVD